MTDLDRLNRAFKENRVWAETRLSFEFDDVIEAEIEWGDWKHDHLRADWIAAETGFTKLGDRVTDEDGSDCYSAIHYYIYTGEEEQI